MILASNNCWQHCHALRIRCAYSACGMPITYTLTHLSAIPYNQYWVLVRWFSSVRALTRRVKLIFVCTARAEQ